MENSSTLWSSTLYKCSSMENSSTWWSSTPYKCSSMENSSTWWSSTLEEWYYTVHMNILSQPLNGAFSQHKLTSFTMTE